jgi:hypothetical protein
MAQFGIKERNFFRSVLAVLPALRPRVRDKQEFHRNPWLTSKKSLEKLKNTGRPKRVLKVTVYASGPHSWTRGWCEELLERSILL